MSNLSELLPSGGGQNVVSLTASGTIAQGKPIVLNSDGTVSEVSSQSESTGSEVVFETAQSYHILPIFDSSNNKIVIIYTDSGDSNHGKAVVGTVSGTGISFGTPVTFNAATTYSSSATFDSNSNKVVIVYKDVGDSNKTNSIVGTVSGTSISFGSEATITTNTINESSTTFDSDSNKVVTFYKDSSNSGYGTAAVGTVSGTSISYGSPVVFESAQSSLYQQSSCFDTSSNKTVVVYTDVGNSSHGTAIVGTVSGTSISFGTPVVFHAAGTANAVCAFDTTNNKVVIAYEDTDDSEKGKSLVGTVSDTSISYGSEVEFESGSIQEVGMTFDPDAGKAVVVYMDKSWHNHGTYAVGTVSGTSITYETPVVFAAATTERCTATYDTNSDKIVIGFEDGGNSNYGTSVVLQAGSSNVSDFLGIAAKAISDSAAGDINVLGGISSVHSGLAIGADYYVQDDGSLGSTSETIAYSLNSASYDNVSFDYSSQDGSGQQVLFNSDGTKMYILGSGNDSVFEYDLSTGYDLSTASYQRSKSVTSEDNFPVGLAFNSNGTKMYIVGNTSDAVYQYSLSSAYDVSTASYDSVSFSVTSQDTHPYGLFFNTDGTKMFIIGDAGNDVNEYALSSGFDISTASYTQNFDISSQDTSPRHVSFNPDGTKMYVVGGQEDKIQVYSLGTGFDLSTASFLRAFAVNTEDTQPNGITFNSDGTKVFLIGESEDKVFQYSAGTGSVTSVLIGQAISTTTINMRNLT